ncbi:beta strand repeat-containing protein, partial [Alishewanella tabrizica]|uniref:beta strand repeat-containing protein n=1 Tax=Alishewanella tabrizica TaxID=671278 RepID=UPI0035712B92
SVAGVDISSLADGALTITASAVDNNGNSINANTGITLDAIDSAITVTAELAADNSLTLSGNTVDVAPGSTVQLTITDQFGTSVVVTALVNADGSYSVAGVDISSLADGALTITASAVDNNGNPISANTGLTLDAIDSAITVAAELAADNSLTLSGNTVDVAPGSTVQLTITDQFGISVVVSALVNADGSYSLAGIDISGLADGALTITATAVDNNGNSINANTGLTLDAIDSAITVTAELAADNSLTLSGNTVDVAPGSTVQLTITDQFGTSIVVTALVNADGSYSLAGVDISSLADGALTITASAVDNNGNPISANTGLTLDAIDSAITVAAELAADNSLTLSGNTVDVAPGSTVALTITDQFGNTVVVNALVNADGSYSLAGVDISSLADGALTITATAVDNNGNPIIANTGITLDAVDSAITVAAELAADNSLTLLGNTVDVAPGSTVEITITDQFGNTVVVTALVNADGSYSVAGVDISSLADGALTITASAVDNNGNPINANTGLTLDAVDSAITVAAELAADNSLTLLGNT